VGESSEEGESSHDTDYHQLLKDYHEIQAILSSTRLNGEMLRGKLDASRDALQASMTEVSKARVNWAILKEQVHNMMNQLVELRTRVETLQLCVQAARNASFPMGTMDNLFTIEEPFRALPARLRAVVTDVVRQGPAMALAAAQLQIGIVVNVRVAEQCFLPESKDDDIVDLVKSFKPPANIVLAKVDMDEILHTRLDP
jgi:hypothetical protein